MPIWAGRAGTPVYIDDAGHDISETENTAHEFKIDDWFEIKGKQNSDAE